MSSNLGKGRYSLFMVLGHTRSFMREAVRAGPEWAFQEGVSERGQERFRGRGARPNAVLLARWENVGGPSGVGNAAR